MCIRFVDGVDVGRLKVRVLVGLYVILVCVILV